jgi:hypothetical protein
MLYMNLICGWVLNLKHTNLLRTACCGRLYRHVSFFLCLPLHAPGAWKGIHWIKRLREFLFMKALLFVQINILMGRS